MTNVYSYRESLDRVTELLSNRPVDIEKRVSFTPPAPTVRVEPTPKLTHEELTKHSGILAHAKY